MWVVHVASPFIVVGGHQDLAIATATQRNVHHTSPYAKRSISVQMASCTVPLVDVIAYVRVSTGAQDLGLEAQRSQITAEAERRDWTVVDTVTDDGASGRTLQRSGLTHALESLDSGSADALVVAKLDRLSRSLLDFATLVERAHRQGWAIIVLDLGVDTTTAAGQLVANVVAAIAEWERSQISERTRDALAELKAQGVRLGRPRLVDDQTRDRIIAARRAGDSYRTIADALNSDQVPTVSGGAKWWPSTIHGVIASAALDGTDTDPTTPNR